MILLPTDSSARQHGSMKHGAGDTTVPPHDHRLGTAFRRHPGAEPGGIASHDFGRERLADSASNSRNTDHQAVVGHVTSVTEKASPVAPRDKPRPGNSYTLTPTLAR